MLKEIEKKDEELDCVRCELGLDKFYFDEKFKNDPLFNIMVLLLKQKNEIIREIGLIKRNDYF